MAFCLQCMHHDAEPHTWSLPERAGMPTHCPGCPGCEKQRAEEDCQAAK